MGINHRWGKILKSCGWNETRGISVKYSWKRAAILVEKEFRVIFQPWEPNLIFLKTEKRFAARHASSLCISPRNERGSSSKWREGEKETRLKRLSRGNLESLSRCTRLNKLARPARSHENPGHADSAFTRRENLFPAVRGDPGNSLEKFLRNSANHRTSHRAI